MTTIIDRTGSIFDSGAEVLVNPVNCVGVAGKGLALEFKIRFLDNQEMYETVCRRRGWRKISPPWFFWYNGIPDRPRAIVNFPTKRHWREPSNIDDIVAGLAEVRRTLLSFTRTLKSTGNDSQQIRSIAFPALGCGLGGLKWEDVRPLIVESMEDIDGLEVHLYGPR